MVLVFGDCCVRFVLSGVYYAVNLWLFCLLLCC